MGWAELRARRAGQRMAQKYSDVEFERNHKAGPRPKASSRTDRGGSPRVFRGPVVLGPGPDGGCVTRAAYYRMIEGGES